MPAESTPSIPPPDTAPQIGLIKCSLCGSSTISMPSRGGVGEGIVILGEEIERICGSCVRSQEQNGLGLDDVTLEDRVTEDNMGLQEGSEDNGTLLERRSREMGARHRSGDDIGTEERRGSELDGTGQMREEERIGDQPDPLDVATPFPVPTYAQPHSHTNYTQSQSLPTHTPRPWITASSTASADAPCHVLSILTGTSSKPPAVNDEDRPHSNPLLDVTKMRIPSIGRSALYPGSIFKGTQTSGRSSYEVEVNFLDVSMTTSTLSGYLSISHLTESHPHLTTFFTAEIIGPNHGFITGSRYQATEHDDLRHWGRFEPFRRTSTRQDMVGEELFLKNPSPDRNRGELRGKERDFAFLRIKERFLVPDHKVRDISGASFAGFYYAMIDFNPPVQGDIPVSTSPTIPKSPLLPTSPTVPRRPSMNVDAARSLSRPADGLRRRRESSGKVPTLAGIGGASATERLMRGEATIRGYYFHSLNQEPFQELFLTHVPQRSSSTFEMR